MASNRSDIDLNSDDLECNKDNEFNSDQNVDNEKISNNEFNMINTLYSSTPLSSEKIGVDETNPWNNLYEMDLSEPENFRGDSENSNKRLRKSSSKSSLAESLDSCNQSFSLAKEEEIYQAFKINISKVLDKQFYKPEEMFETRLTVAPADLKEKIHGALVSLIDAHNFPHFFKPETEVSVYIDAILTQIIIYIKNQKQNDCYDLSVTTTSVKHSIVGNYKDELNAERTIVFKGRSDHAILFNRYFLGQVLMVFEEKTSDLKKGLIQLILQMLSVKSNSSKYSSTTYGVLCTGDVFILAILKDQLIISSKQIFLVPELMKYKKEWLENHSVLIDILYHVICDALK